MKTIKKDKKNKQKITFLRTAKFWNRMNLQRAVLHKIIFKLYNKNKITKINLMKSNQMLFNWNHLLLALKWKIIWIFQKINQNSKTIKERKKCLGMKNYQNKKNVIKNNKFKLRIKIISKWH